MREKVEIQKDQMEVTDRNKQNFVMIEHAIIDSLYFDSIYQKMVYLNLKRFANWHTQESFPTVATLAKLTMCSDRKVTSTLKELEGKRLIEIKERFDGKQQLSNLYIILEYPAELFELDYRKEGVNEVHPPKKEKKEGVNEMHQGGEPHSPEGCTSFTGGVNEMHTNNKDLKDKDLDKKDLKIVNNSELTNNDLLTIIDSFYNKFSPNRWNKEQWKKTVSDRVLQELKRKDLDSIENLKGFIHNWIENISKKHDLKNKKIESDYENALENSNIPKFDYLEGE